MGDAPMRDYTVSLSIPKGRLEIGFDLLLMDDNIDMFDTRDDSDSDEEDKAEDEKHNDIGDLFGVRAFLNYGLSDRTAFQSVFVRRDLEYGDDGSLKISSGDLWVRQVLSNEKYGNFPYVVTDVGMRFNMLDDAGNAPFSKMADYTPFARLTAGFILEDLFPNVFAEYGHSMIDAEFDADANIVKLDSDGNVEEVSDPKRNEHQFRTGLGIMIRFPYTSMFSLEYSYVRLIRDDGEYRKDNHIVKSDVCRFITESLILNLGCTYYYRQYNGVIPFLCNDFTRNDFDQSYLEAHVGLTYLFGGRRSG